MAEVTPAPLEERKRMLRASLSFDAVENPTWHKKGCQEVSVKEMLNHIMKYQKKWEEKKRQYEPELVQKVYQEFLAHYISHVNKEEEKGFSTFEETDNVLSGCFSRYSISERRDLSIKELETINLRNAYEHLLDKIKREERPGDYGLMEASLLQETHRKLMEDIPLRSINSTKHGMFSNKERNTTYKGIFHMYKNPENMTAAVEELLDQVNIMFDRCTKDGLKDYDDLYYLFKACAWMLMKLLDLHPFADGNGRLCRMLCSYMLSKFTPFPTPVYNVWTDSCKDDYMRGLIDARKNKERPTALTTMIIESNYHGWRKFFEALDDGKSRESSATD